MRFGIFFNCQKKKKKKKKIKKKKIKYKKKKTNLFSGNLKYEIIINKSFFFFLAADWGPKNKYKLIII